MRKESHHFSRGFKRDAVQLVLEKGVPVRKVARDLDIHPNLLHQWRKPTIDPSYLWQGFLSTSTCSRLCNKVKSCKSWKLTNIFLHD